MKEPVYLDNHTCTPPSASAIEVFLSFCKDLWGSPYSLHQKGQELFAPIDATMMRIFEGMGADFEDKLVLTSNAAEAIQEVFLATYIEYTRETGKNHFLSTCIEGEAINRAKQTLQKLDCSIKLLPVDSCGRLRPETLQDAIKPRVTLLSLSWANPLTGVIQPIEDLARICREKNILLHVDASAVIGKLFFRFKDSGVDYLTFEGDQFHSIRGIGGLFCRKEQKLEYFNTNDFPTHIGAIAALGVAIEEAQRDFDGMCMETARLRDKFENALCQALPECRVFFQEADRLPHISAVAFPGIESESLLYALNRRGVYATTGGGKTQKLRSILEHCGVAPSLAACALSFALSSRTQEEQIDRAVTSIVEAVSYGRTLTGGLL